MPNSVYSQALDAVVTQIRTLDLVEDIEVQVRRFHRDETFRIKGITVSWGREREAEGTNERDDIGYPCIVTMVSGRAGGWVEDVTNTTDWRQKIRRLFINKKITGVSDTGTNDIICTVQHLAPDLPRDFEEGYDVSQLIVWCWFRESRA